MKSKKRKRKLNKFALGGALVIGALFIFYLSEVLFVCKQNGGLVKNNPSPILPWTKNQSCPLDTPRMLFAEQWLNKPEPEASVAPVSISQNWGGDIFVKLGRNIAKLATKTVFAYDQQNTHPALTGAAVDFYNLNFPDNPLSEEDKKLLIRGVIEEDVPPRYLNHFYDPVYNKSWSDYTTSKKWALDSFTQQAFTDSAFSYGGFANLFSDNLSPTDFSYPRALHDYASGNRKRAMLAMGHVMHLLEDANVPEHTRGDIHLWWHGTESPYEKTMAKWNPSNIDIENKLIKNSQKPILLSQMGDYFDEIARYSNGYFFSEDTIFISRYNLPKKVSEKVFLDEGLKYKFGMGIDRNGDQFPLFRINTASNWRNLITETKLTVNSNLILDDYWSRLAPDFVIHGAGALKLFLDQAELVKQEYASNTSLKRQSSGLVGQFLGLLGLSTERSTNVIFDQKQIEKIIDVGSSTSNNDVGLIPSSFATPSTTPSPSPTPFPTPLSSSPTPFGTSSPLPTSLDLGDINNGHGVQTPSPSPTPNYYTGPTGGSSGSNSSNDSITETPTPTPTPLESLGGDLTGQAPLPTPLPSPTPLETTPIPSAADGAMWQATTSGDPTLTEQAPTPTPSPESSDGTADPTPSPTISPTPIPSPSSSPSSSTTSDTTQSPSGQVIINEIAWMGTENTATLSSDEWLELYNPTSSPVNVDGWRLKSLTDNSPDITLAPKTIEPYGFFLLERTSDDTVSDIPADRIYTGNLNDGGEILELRDSQGNLVDLVGNSLTDSTGLSQADAWFAGDKSTRSSMERIDPMKIGNDPTNWGTNDGLTRNGINAAGNPINGTPGRQNSVISNQTENQVKSAISDDSSISGLVNPSIQWMFQIPNVLRFGQPAVAPDGTIYVSAPSYDPARKLRLYALNQDGSEKWFWENNSAEPSELTVSADGSVYFGQFDPGSHITALNPDGSQRWQYGIGDRVNSVALDAKGNVYFTSENRRINKVKPDGELDWWSHDTFTFGFTPITGVDEDVYLGANISGLPGFYKLNNDDGVKIWQTRVKDNVIYSQFDPVFDQDEDKFFSITTGYGQILTYDKSGGPVVKNDVDRQGVPTTKVAILDDLLVLGLDFELNRPGSGSFVYAVSKEDKSEMWTYQVDSPVNKRIVVDSEHNLYFATRSGTVYSLDSSGQKRWVRELGEATESYPVLWDGSVIINTGGKLFKISD